MPRTLTDDEITSFVAESKPLPKNWTTRLRPRAKSNYQHAQRDLEVEGKAGNRFRIIIRKNAINALEYSLIQKQNQKRRLTWQTYVVQMGPH